MAHVLNLVKGGTTVTLMSGGIVSTYLPRRPQLSANQLDQIVKGYVSKFNEPQVSEAFEARISAASVTALQTAYQQIETLLTIDAPLAYKNDEATKVYANWQPDGTSTLYRSEIIGGAIEIMEPVWLTHVWSQNKTIKVLITWTRRYFWEGAETQIPLTNDNGTNDTSGLNVYACADGSGSSPNKRVNHVQIAAADVVGVIPAPCRIQAFNNNGVTLESFYVGHMAGGLPGSLIYQYEGEAATLNATYGTALAAATGSGGTVAHFSTAIPGTAVTLATWSLTTAQLTAMASNWFNLFVRFGNSGLPSNSTLQLQFRLVDSVDTTTVLAETGWMTPGTTDQLKAIDVLRIMPSVLGLPTYKAVNLVLRARDSAAAATFRLDLIQLVAVENSSSFRSLKAIVSGNGISSGYYVFDDGIEQDVYVTDLTDKRKTFQGFGGPIMLRPNTLQRLFILFNRASGVHTITDVVVVKLYYRPRYLTI